jgi:hypothetical protein
MQQLDGQRGDVVGDLRRDDRDARARSEQPVAFSWPTVPPPTTRQSRPFRSRQAK